MASNPSTSRKKLVFLTGFMGSGKSTIGPILANTLGFAFVDVDRLIEKKANQKIVDIFDGAGEKAFRSVERQALQEVASMEEAVVSLGGGTIANEENFEFVHRNGIIVYIQLSPDEILHRVQYRTDRPMLRDEKGDLLTGPSLDARVHELLNVREKYYSRADIIVPAGQKKVGATVDDIVRKLRKFV